MQRTPMVRFDRVTVVTVEVLKAAGLRLEPTGRNPRHDDIALDDLADGVRRLCGCEHEVVVNPYHEPRGAQETTCPTNSISWLI